MNSIVADPVSDQTDCQAVCNGDDTEVNRKDCAAVLRSELETRNASTVSPEPECARLLNGLLLKSGSD
jgi:hypothetical protein